jgi:CRP/FNR family transcriptional regulator, dissimilatory nitrate respiration regulator
MSKRLGQAKADEQSRAFVRRLPFFRALDPAAFEQLIAACAVRVLAPAEDLFMQDEEGENFSVLLSGKLEIYRVSSDGEETLIRILDRGEAFSSGMTISFTRHPFCARAVGAARVLTGPRETVVRLMRENGAAAVDFAGSMSGNLRVFADHIEELRALPALDRLQAFLRRLGSSGATAADLSALPYKKIFIARAIGVTPETLSRLLAKMRAPLAASLRGFDCSAQPH